MLKVFSKITIAALAVFTGAMAPMARFVPVSAAGGTKYISEVRVGMDKTEAGAVSGLLADGFTILSKDGKYADLNEDAGSNDAMARGQKKVYLGYKTTYNPNEAITDLAVMNMRGGYSVRDYEALMEKRLKTEIIPFVNRFLVTLDEYRDNLNSPYPTNKARAEYMKTMLNKLQDDDTGGLLGNLLVNETKFEMGDEAYNALNETEQKNHADILTIVMQANGKSTLAMESLLTKASDTASTSWIDRLKNISLDDLKQDLIDEGTDPVDVNTVLDQKYGDAANKILEKWDTFSHALMDYEDKASALASIDEHDNDEQIRIMEQYDENSSDLDKNGEAIYTGLQAKESVTMESLDFELVAAKERLDDVDYDFGEGTTLSEFFALDSSTFNKDGIRDLYPVVASLSAGQIAGLDFLSLQDLVTIATADATSYENNDYGDLDPVSIYDGVNREIFEKGKVALTNKALRAEAMKNDAVFDHPLSASTYILWGATAIATAGMIASWVVGSRYINAFKELQATKGLIEFVNRGTIKQIVSLTPGNSLASELAEINKGQESLIKIFAGEKYANDILKGDFTEFNSDLAVAATKSKIAVVLGTAFTVAMAALAAFSIYSTVKELLDYYKVDYSPIPKYIVEEKSITETVNGVTTVKRNDSAYYRAVECNRPTTAEYYDQLQNYADLNGDVGKEWLALYYLRQEGHAPIKADSLKVVKGTSSIPSGYSELGIHNFENNVAYNLTSKYYCYNDAPNGTFVYFQIDESVVNSASTAGSNFSTGSAILFSGIGIVVGAGIGVAIMLVLTKRKEINTTQE